MNILVTGGAGFIGSHVVERLLRENHRVVCFDNFDDYYDPNLKRKNLHSVIGVQRFDLVEGDIRNEKLLDEIFSAHHIDCVVHLAAKVGVRLSLQHAHLYEDVNVRGTLSVLEAAKKCGVRKIVFASSSSVYGINRKVPFSESDAVDYPISPYAATKRACELLCHPYHHLYAMDIFCLRLFTVYGPRQRPEMAIHKFTRLIDEGKEIPIYGDGTSERDYTYIDDAVDGVMSAIEHLQGYEIFNIGESRTITLDNLIHILEECLGKKAIVLYSSMAAGDVQRTWADVHKASERLSYHPTTGIEDGLREFVRWYRAQRG